MQTSAPKVNRAHTCWIRGCCLYMTPCLSSFNAAPDEHPQSSTSTFCREKQTQDGPAASPGEALLHLCLTHDHSHTSQKRAKHLRQTCLRNENRTSTAHPNLKAPEQTNPNASPRVCNPPTHHQTFSPCAPCPSFASQAPPGPYCRWLFWAIKAVTLASSAATDLTSSSSPSSRSRIVREEVARCSMSRQCARSACTASPFSRSRSSRARTSLSAF